MQNQKCYFARTHARLSGRFYFSFKFSPVICFALYVIRTKFMKSYSVSECWAAQHDILFSDSVWVNFALFIFCILLFYYFYILLYYYFLLFSFDRFYILLFPISTFFVFRYFLIFCCFHMNIFYFNFFVVFLF